MASGCRQQVSLLRVCCHLQAVAPGRYHEGIVAGPLPRTVVSHRGPADSSRSWGARLRVLVAALAPGARAAKELMMRGPSRCAA
jgi:hypothetical protein